MVLGVLGKKGLTAHYFFCFIVSEGVTVGSALSPSMSSSFTKALGLGRTASESSSPRSSDASMTRKNKLWPFSKKVLEGDPAMTLIQLDVKRGDVNNIVNDSIRSSYQVRQAKVHASGRTLLPISLLLHAICATQVTAC
ncbi:TPA: hypothetical protein ACH3X2_013048 [Trebouxia sp. C0005]